jgi:hypothetical protein
MAGPQRSSGLSGSSGLSSQSSGGVGVGVGGGGYAMDKQSVVSVGAKRTAELAALVGGCVYKL